MRLSHNMNSLSIYNVYNKNLKANAASIDKISSGQKINSAKDNPNKIGQSEQMRIQLKSLQSAQRNLQDGTSMLQAADGALQETSNILIRIKELTIRAGDGINSEEDRKIIQKEINQMNDTIKSFADNTEFNGVKLLGNKDVINNNYPIYKSIVVGSMVGEQANIPMFNISPSALKDKDGNTLEEIDVVNPQNSDKAISLVDNAINIVSSIRSKYGAISNVLESTATSMDENYSVIQKVDSNIRDTNVATEMAEFARSQILIDSSLALIAQSNNFPKDALRVLERI